MEYQVARGGDTTIKMHSVKVSTGSKHMGTKKETDQHESALSILTDSEADLLDNAD